MVYPGMNLHARERFEWVPSKFGNEIGPGKTVLDAGCGNGMLSYQAWKRGANVMGISIKQNEIEQCRATFAHCKTSADHGLTFENINLYNLDPTLNRFDSIICTEVLEHITNDTQVCEKFYQLLKPGGVLHITTPNAEHPYNKAFPLDTQEKGGHVRPGYTETSFRMLLEPIGFNVENISGLGGPIRQFFDDKIKTTQEKLGPICGVPIFAIAMPFLVIDRFITGTPFCLYVRARRA